MSTFPGSVYEAMAWLLNRPSITRVWVPRHVFVQWCAQLDENRLVTPGDIGSQFPVTAITVQHRQRIEPQNAYAKAVRRIHWTGVTA